MVQTMPALGHSAARQHALETASLLHPHPELVTAPLFDGRQPFFLAVDKVQVKYEMLRAHLVDGLAVTAAAANHGYSRPAFYLVEASFQERGMLGLLDERRGRQGPLKLTPESSPTCVAPSPLSLERSSPTRSSGYSTSSCIDARWSEHGDGETVLAGG